MKFLFFLFFASPCYAIGTYTQGQPTDNGFTTIIVSTVACGTSPTLVFSTNTVAVGTLFCNEDASTIRVGGSNISSTIGQAVFTKTCISLDTPPRFFRANLYCISTTGSNQNSSSTQESP